MTRPILSSDFATVAPDELALLARMLRHVAAFPKARAIATALLAEFGGLPAVMFADESRLRTVGLITDAVVSELALIRTVHEDLARARLRKRPLIGSWSELVAYCRIILAHDRFECFRVLFIDRKNHLIADEEFARGSVDHVAVYPRRIIARALELDACALILAHNHPSGDPTPSPDDIAMTGQIRDAARLFGIVLHDHVIVSVSGELSFRSEGLL
ncbi:MAG: DNA repair protein RadC [Deltaproteobacteria bacterium]